MNLNLQPTLENELIFLRPLHEDDFEALYQVAKDPLIWDQHVASERYKREVFIAFFDDAIQSKGTLIVINKYSKEVIGSSRFKSVVSDESAIEIGWSFLARKYWGGTHNKSMKTLMIGYAFQSIEHVIFHVAKDNFRSQRAVGKLGGIKITDEKYRHLLKADGTHFTYRIHKAQWMSSANTN